MTSRQQHERIRREFLGRDYDAFLRGDELWTMTASEFLAFAGEWLSDAYESFAEHEAQYQSECAMFGDAGPGQGLGLREMRQGLAKVERQVARLEALRSDA